MATRTARPTYEIGRRVGVMWRHRATRLATFLAAGLLWAGWLVSQRAPPDPASARDARQASTSSATPASASASAGGASRPEAKATPSDQRATLVEIEKRLVQAQERLAHYYATDEELQVTMGDLVLLVAIEAQAASAPGSTNLVPRARALSARVEQQARAMFASSLEENFVRHGFDMRLRATGREKDQLRVAYALMSRPLVYKFESDMGLSDKARLYGFKKVIYTNGFESELEQTWTIEVK